MSDEVLQPPEAGHTYYSIHKPTIWERLGFRYPPDRHFDWRNQERDDLVISVITSKIRIHVTFLDRLRLLVSGKAEVTIYTRTNVEVEHAESVSVFMVLPP